MIICFSSQRLITIVTNWGLKRRICNSDISLYLFICWLASFAVPSHYPNQSWQFLIWAPMNEIQLFVVPYVWFSLKNDMISGFISVGIKQIDLYNRSIHCILSKHTSIHKSHTVICIYNRADTWLDTYQYVWSRNIFIILTLILFIY